MRIIITQINKHPLNKNKTTLASKQSNFSKPIQNSAKTQRRSFSDCMISDTTMADEAKSRGNAAFSSGDFTSAIRHFTEAIDLAPTNHVLFSNRSAAHASLHQYADALSDAEKAVELKRDWTKGYIRLGAAHLGLNQFQEAVVAYKKGLEIDPSNEALKSGLADAHVFPSRSRAARSRSNPFGNAFQGPEMWAKLTADPSTRGFLQQPDFVDMMQEIQKNPSNLRSYSKDHRVMQSLGVLLNIKFRRPVGNVAEVPESDMAQTPRKEPEVEKQPEPEPKQEPALTEEKEKKDRKQKVQNEKAMGTAANKKRDFETAIQHYSTAMEIDDEDISYITNRAALTKIAKCSKDYEPAIETFQKALTEHRKPEVLNKLNNAEREKKEWEQKEYFDPLKEYENAMETYQEGLKHDPNNQELLDGVRRCIQQISKANRGDLAPEELKERQAKGMQDPEIQNILTDPVIRQVLTDLQENLTAAQKHMQNPMVKNKIWKLINAGIVQVKYTQDR